MKLADFCHHKESFLSYLQTEKNLSSHTVRAYESDLRQLIEFWEKTEARENRSLALQPVVERHFAALDTKKINKSSIARKISCMHSYEKFIETTLQAKLNLHLVRPRIDKKAPLFLSVDEIFYLLDTLPAEKMDTPFPARDKAIFELLYATGVRCSELVAIKIKDINFNEKKIFVPGKKERMVIFGSACEKKLLTYLSKERVVIKNPAEHLFLNYRNEPLTTRSVQRICEMFRNFLEVKRPLTPHKLRHSFAAHMLDQGADARTVQELLGHTSLASVEKYTHETC